MLVPQGLLGRGHGLSRRGSGEGAPGKKGLRLHTQSPGAGKASGSPWRKGNQGPGGSRGGVGRQEAWGDLGLND